MSLTTSAVDPVPPRHLRDDNTAPYPDDLQELIEIGMDVAREVRRQIGHDDITEVAAAFDRVARAVRRTIHLAQRLAEAPNPQATRAATRRRIVRAVENAIAREATQATAPALHAELAERLDDPVLDEDIDTRPVAEVIEEICRDLGVDYKLPGLAFPRRTPADVQDIARRAAAPNARPAPAISAPRPGWRPPAHPAHAIACNDDRPGPARNVENPEPLNPGDRKPPIA